MDAGAAFRPDKQGRAGTGHQSAAVLVSQNAGDHTVCIIPDLQFLDRQLLPQGFVEGIIAVSVSGNAAENRGDLSLHAAADSFDGLKQQFSCRLSPDIQGIAACGDIPAEDVTGLVKEHRFCFSTSAVNGNEIIQ